MTLMNVLSLFGGLGLFLFGMKTMGEGLEKAAGNRLRRLLEMVTRNRLLAMLAGVAITALIQSSAATTVMVVGFVNAELLSLTQAVGVIMGANVGTTVTPLMLSLQIDFAVIFACIGLVLNSLPEKYASARQFGQVVMGMGILFVGMNTMKAAMAPLKDWEGFRAALLSMSNPVVGVLIGAAITALLHSSAASIGILQALAGEGLIPLSSAVFVLFGQNIGTCVTALIACSGTNITAKRAAAVHLLFNMIGTALFTVIAVVLPFAHWIEVIAPDNLMLQIAVTHIFFNIVTTAMLLPLAGLLEKAACLLVPGNGKDEGDMKLMFFDARLLKTPPFAVAQLFKEVQRMGDIALKNFAAAVDCFRQWDEEKAADIEHHEQVLDYLNQAITASLVDVKGLDLNERDTRLVGALFHVVNDFERVGDHSQNILEAAQLRERDGVKFSMKAISELDSLSAMVAAQLDAAMRLFRKQIDDPAQLEVVIKGEQDIDELTEALRTHHVERLKSRKCSAKNGMIYLDMLTNLERIGDHAENIATSVSKAK